MDCQALPEAHNLILPFHPSHDRFLILPQNDAIPLAVYDRPIDIAIPSPFVHPSCGLAFRQICRLTATRPPVAGSQPEELHLPHSKHLEVSPPIYEAATVSINILQICKGIQQKVRLF